MEIEIVKEILKEGGIGVLPTDTIYGLVGKALDQNTVERIYSVRKRNPEKPLIILISSIDDLKLFSIKLSDIQLEIVKKYWPGKVTFIFDCDNQELEYLHRGKKSLAFRVPDVQWLRNLISETGPLVAPSANFEGDEPAKNIKEAKKYFEDSVDFYIDQQELISQPSTIVKINDDGKIEIIREGSVKI